MYDDDTIAGIATSPINSGISIIRLSGDNAINIAKKIFVNGKKNRINEFKNRYLHYGYIIDQNKKIVDEVLLACMKKTNTYTKEDVIEIHCHGGIISSKKILDLVLNEDCRLAERGEFTKRAFLNGRIDLIQAEAVIDLINSKTEYSHGISLNQLEGRLSKEINLIINKLVSLIANIEVNIDFPEYDEDQITIEQIRNISKSTIKRLDKLIKTADTGKIYKEGIRTVILGKPNVGKSSLMNFLLDENRAIVTEIPGTTRDIIEEFMNIDGIPIIVIDTAGIRNTKDEVEKIGVERALEKVESSDLIIMVFDASKKLEKEDIEILKYIENRKVIYLKNKTDLDDILNLSDYKYIEKEIIDISVKNNIGLDKITKKIKDMFFKGVINLDNDLIINNSRHKALLIKAKNNLEDILLSINNNITIEFLEIDLNNCIENLGKITGRSVQDDLVDKIFNEFCIGK